MENSPTSWNEASWLVLRRFAETGDNLKYLPDTDARLRVLRDIQLDISRCVRDMVDNPNGAYVMAHIVHSAGDAARIAIGYAMDIEASFDYAGMHGILCRKQHDYGHENINMFGIVGVGIRLCDKIARLHNLYANDIDPDNEAVDDTWADIVGYGVLADMLQQDWFKLQLEDDFNEPF